MKGAYMYYLKCFLLYSVLGFIWESVVYKVSGSSDHSGVLLGPYTLVYGFGGLLTVIVNNYLTKLDINSFVKYFLLFISFTIICTLIEYIIGNLIHIIFNFDKWNYTSHRFHFGKYICLDYALVWGALALAIVHLLKPFFDKVLLLVPNSSTFIILGIMIVDLIYTLITKGKIT